MNNFLLASILYNYNLLYLEQPKKALNAQYDHNITYYLLRPKQFSHPGWIILLLNFFWHS